MPRPDSSGRLAAMLAAVREAVEATSLRRVAAEIGLTPSGLQRILDSGGTVWASTQAKLRRWYVRHAALISSTDEATARAALDVLTAGVGEPKRRELASALLDRIAAVHVDQGVPVPKWLDELRGSD